MDPQAWRRAQAGAGARTGLVAPARGRRERRPRLQLRRRRRRRPGRPVRRAVRRPRGRGGRGWGPVPGADQTTEIQLTVEEAYHGTAARSAHRRRRHPDRGGDDPAGSHRRAADPAGWPGRPRQRRSPQWRPVPGGPDRAAPALPARGPRPVRGAAARALGGRPRHVGRVPDPRRRCQGQGAGGNIVRPAAAAARPRPAQPEGPARRPARRSQDHGAAPADRGRAGAVRAASCRIRSSTRGGGGDLRHRPYDAARPGPFRRGRGHAPGTRPQVRGPGHPRRYPRPGRAACGSLPARWPRSARIQRLRAGFALNYAAIGLVTDLLDRIAALQRALRRTQGPAPNSIWGYDDGPGAPDAEVAGGLARRAD